MRAAREEFFNLLNSRPGIFLKDAVSQAGETGEGSLDYCFCIDFLRLLRRVSADGVALPGIAFIVVARW